MNTSTLTLLQLPRELIYKIAAEDASVYNRVLRLCRALTILFPLSTRLDFMIAFGVTIECDCESIYWIWNGCSHDIFGPAETHDDGSRSYYYRDELHRIDKPAAVWSKGTQWSIHGQYHRDLAAPSGTGVEWLRGAACLYIGFQYYAEVAWYQHGAVVRQTTRVINTAEYKQVCAEVAYWLSAERQ